MVLLSATSGRFGAALLAASVLAGSASGAAPAQPLPKGAVARFGSARLHHGTWIRHLAFSPDGRLLSCGGQHRQPGEICLWEPSSGRLVRSLPGHRYGTLSASFSPDGQTLLTAGQDNTQKFWTVATGKPAAGFAVASDKGRGTWAVFSPDGRRVALCDGTNVHVSDPDGTRHVRISSQRLRYCCFSPDNKLLAAVSSYTKSGAGLWDRQTGKLVRQLDSSGRRFTIPAFSPDGARLAAGCNYGPDAGSVILWDTASGKIARRLKGAGRYIQQVAFSSDGALLAAAARTDAVAVWDVRTGRTVRTLSVVGDRLYAVAFSPDGKRVAAGGLAGQVRLWRLPSFEVDHPGTGHAGAVTDADVSHDGRLVLTGGADGTVWLWEARSGRPIRRLLESDREILSVVISPGGRLLAAGGADNAVRVWEAPSGKLRHTVSLPGGAAFGIAFPPGGGRLLALGPAGAVTVVDVRTGALSPGASARKQALIDGELSPDGVLAATTDRQAAYVVDAATGRSVGAFAPVGTGYVYGLAVDPYGRALACDLGQKVQLFELDSGRLIREVTVRALAVPKPALAFSPDGWVLAVGSEGSVVFWSVATGQRLAERKGHRNRLAAVRFSDDGRHAISCGADTTAILWSLKDLPGDPEAAEPDANELPALWKALAADKPADALTAIRRLVAGGDRSVSFLAEQMRSARAPSEADLAKLIAAMGDDRFAVRRAAFEQIARLGAAAETALRRAVRESASEEVRARARQLLAAMDDPLRRSPGVVRSLRAVRLLERIGSAKAAELLRTLAGGSPTANLTRRASAALRRLAAAGKPPPAR